MKKIAFVMGTIMLGGAERALINMLNYFDYDNYQVVLWICGEEKGNVELINKRVEIYHVKSEFAVNHFSDTVDQDIIRNKIKRLSARVLARLLVSNEEKNKHYYSICLPKISGELYDIVIAYRGWDASILRFAFNRFYAKKRIVWMHNDTYVTEFPFPRYYKKADRIFCVSNTIKMHMLEKYNGINGKVDVFYNILDKKDIIKKSEQKCDTALLHPCILSVGRLSWEKGFEIIPETVHLLKRKGYDFKWYIIGEGYKRREIEPLIEKFHIQDKLILLGAKDNPYPYFKECDIFVQTSITEGYCITTAEAKLFCKPVVTTNIPVMYEQFEDHKNGIIVKAKSPESLMKGISELIDNDDLYQSIVQRLKIECAEDRITGFMRLYNFIDK